MGVVSFTVPPVDKPAKARLGLRLVSGGNLVASTEQEFWIFPNPSPARSGAPAKTKRLERVYSPEFRTILEHLGYEAVSDLSQAELAVVSTLDDSYRDFLLGGGRVLLLAETDDALRTRIPGVGLVAREGSPWQGDWASSFGWHRFESLPTGNVVNFAFADLTPDHVLHGFAPRDFALDVFAGLFVGWVQRPVPTIARRHVGRGALLISTFRLAKNIESNPLAGYLFAELMKLIADTKTPISNRQEREERKENL